jgi:hypothetical protein
VAAVLNSCGSRGDSKDQGAGWILGSTLEFLQVEVTSWGMLSHGLRTRALLQSPPKFLTHVVGPRVNRLQAPNSL